MRFRKLRIAWSVGWGSACVLLVVLWVRSYAVIDKWLPDFSTTWGIAAFSDSGEVSASVVHMDGGAVDIWFIAIPYWLLFTLSAIAGPLPLLRWSNRFTLRTLLIATTLVAVVLALVVYAVRYRAGH
jgi:hypothetical protein